MKKMLLILAAILYTAVPNVVLGQTGTAHFSAQLTGDQENPAVTSAGTGTGTFSLTDAGLAYNITFEGITITASHFHLGATGVNGGVVRAIDFAGGNTVSGIWTPQEVDQPLTDALIADLVAGNIYVNLHTSDHGSGELRGQVTLSGGGIGLSAKLTGDQENPAVTSAGTGTGTFSLTDAGLAYDITFEGITITASHFHLGATGVNGGVVRAIDFAGGNTVSGVWTPEEVDQPLTDALIADLVAGNIYVNLHTSDHGSGELRGQVTLSGGGIGLSANLTGDQENPPVTSAGTGTGTFSLTDAGLAYDITFEGITITASHFHLGATGVNGGVVRAIDFAGGNTVSGVWTPEEVDQPLTDALIADLVAGNIYVNLHTSDHGSGELRGQLSTQDVVTAVADEPTVIPRIFVLLQNYPNPFNPTTTIEYVLPRSAEVLLTIYNLRGQEAVRLFEGQQTGGYHTATWNASHMASGIYFYRLQAGEFVQTRKMLLLK